MYAGIYTPTEAGGIGFLVSLIYVVAKKRIDLLVHRSWIRNYENNRYYFLIIAGAKIFGKAISLYRIPQDLSTLIVSNINEQSLFVFVVCVTLLVLGLIMETLSLILIMMPIFAVSIAAMNIDLIWFGIIFTLMIECALITPPVGLNIYVLQAIGKLK